MTKLTEERKVEIRTFIKDNYDKMSNREMAIQLGISRGSLNSYVAHKNRVPKLKITTKPKPKVKRKSKSNVKITTTPKVKVKGVFTNYDGIGKRKSRELIFKAFEDYFTENNIMSNAKILSLCANNVDFEIRVRDAFAKFISYDLVERDMKVFCELLHNIADAKLKCNVYNCDVIDIIKKALPNEYDALILDYCGQLDKHFHDLNIVFRNQIVKKNGIISITFNDRCQKGGIVKNINELCGFDIEGTQVLNALNQFILYCGACNYKILNTFKYKDEGHDGMIHMLIKRVN
jgi:hypothetical protein